MSAALYSARLYWDGRKGCIKAHGVYLPLDAAPTLPGQRVMIEEVDFTPEVYVARIRELACAWRDMTADEIRAAHALLDEFKGGT